MADLHYVEKDGHMDWCERNCDTCSDGTNACVAFAQAHREMEEV